MKKLLTLIIVFAALFILALPSAPVTAASEYTVRISESQLNYAARRTMRDFPELSNYYFEVQEGRLGVVLIGNYGYGTEKFILGLIPAANNGQIIWTVMGVSINDQYAPPEALPFFNDGGFSTAINDDIINPSVAGYGRNIYFTSIKLSNHTITLTFTNNGAPPAGGGTTTTTQPSGSTSPTGCTVRTTTELRLRAEPNTSSATLTVVPAAVTFTPITLQASWVQVNYNGSQGWLYRPYLRTSGCPR